MVDKKQTKVDAAIIERAILNTDGGSRGNPGQSGIGFTVRVANSAGQPETICRGGAYIGLATNNIAEYRALIWGLQNALELSVQDIVVVADSELMIKQLSGEYRVKNVGIKPLYNEAMRLLSSFKKHTVGHVLRENNKEADALANEAMDKRGACGDYVCEYLSGDLFNMFELEDVGIVDTASADKMVVASDNMATGIKSADDVGSATDAAVSAMSSAAGSATDATAIASVTASDTSSSVDRTGTYTLWIKGHFDAAHALVGYPGECKNLHGHTWDVEVSIEGNKLDDVGIVYDFKDLKNNLMSILDSFDHKYLNEIAPFDKINATAENLARVIYEQMEALLPMHVRLVEIAVWESPIAKLTYRK